MQHDQTIYKVVTAGQWALFKQQGLFHGSVDDVHDGFIHCSTWQQLPGTLAKHFAGRTGLVLLTIATASIADQVKWEISRNDQWFPHIYANLKLTTVQAWQDIPMDERGGHDLNALACKTVIRL